jgi:hypothetical protein
LFVLLGVILYSLALLRPSWEPFGVLGMFVLLGVFLYIVIDRRRRWK